MNIADLRTETGIARIKYMFNAVYRRSEAGRLILLSLKTQQIESGIDQPLLEYPDTNILYLTPTWLTSLRKFLGNHQIRIFITNIYRSHRKGHYDDTIMNQTLLTRYTISQQLDINRVRLYLQAFRLSDLQDPTDSTLICAFSLNGKRSPQFVTNSAWPQQPHVTAKQQRLWKKYITSNFIRYDRKWRNSPSEIHPSQLQAPHPKTPTSYHTLEDYLRSLDKWLQRLLSDYTQEATDTRGMACLPFEEMD
jgi:hypothetical protein